MQTDDRIIEERIIGEQNSGRKKIKKYNQDGVIKKCEENLFE